MSVKILLAVDGSESSQHATRKVIESLQYLKAPPSIEVLAVHLPIPHVPHMSLVVNKEAIESYYAEESAQMLDPVRALLDGAGVRYEVKTRIGRIAETIADEASASQCDCLYMGTHGSSAMRSMVLGSITMRVLHLTQVPVVLVH